MTGSFVEIVGTALFTIAVLHTFLTSKILHLSHRFPAHSIPRNLFHLLGEVELVFGVWAGVLVLFLIGVNGTENTVKFLEGLNFTEPLFVFVIMTIAGSKPIIEFARRFLFFKAKWLPIHREMAVYFVCMSVGPLMGSLITEPAAMTVAALILRDRYYDREISDRFKYITIAILFVNISIGGVLTPYAAPPVLMVASTWGWDLSFMLEHFGYKSVVAVLINAMGATFLLQNELRKLQLPKKPPEINTPAWILALHLLFLGAVVVSAHHSVIFMGLFLFFLGAVSITSRYHEALKLRESLLVGFFLAGLVVLGSFQAWWLSPILKSLDSAALFLGATALTAITDNAALTYLGSQVEGLSDLAKFALVAGAICGGGLTVIANAPNPAGFSILQSRFGEDGIHPLKLLLFALIPTLVAMGSFWLLPF